MNHKKAHWLMKAGLLLIATTFLLLLPAGKGGTAAAQEPHEPDIQGTLLPLVGGALVEARDGHWDKAAAELEQFEKQWQALHPAKTPLAENVATALAEARQALAGSGTKPDEAYAAISRLAKATQAFVNTQQTGGQKTDGKAAAKSLLPTLRQCLSEIRQQHWEQANQAFKRFDAQWLKMESAIRADNKQVYGEIETKMSLARISLQAEPPKAEAAEGQVAALLQTVENYAHGKMQKNPDGADHPNTSRQWTVQDAMDLLNQADGAIRSGNIQEAANHLQSFINAWLAIEGVVQTRDPQTYARIENQMTEAVSDLLSNPPRVNQASKTIDALQSELAPFANQTRYTAWDAAAILLREGLEALLILAALLAFLRRTGNASRQKWVWNGAIAGLLTSALLAIVLNYALSNVTTGSARELLEGGIGLIAVVLMLAVGIWLHDKSRMKAWNEYIHQQVGMALASGNLWSLFLVSGLAILREGAETTIFYIGMAPSIDPVQLLAGIGLAAVLLLLLGFVIVKGSARLPIRPLFLGATALIYYLVIKFLGESIHALQVAGKIPSHVSEVLPSWNWIGCYPTWETAIPQVMVLLFILYQVFRVERKAVRQNHVHDAAK